MLLNVVTGGESREQRAYGDFLDEDDRYVRTSEFLQAVKELWRGETVTLDGAQVHVEEAVLSRMPDPVPPIDFGGSSSAAVDVESTELARRGVWTPPAGSVTPTAPAPFAAAAVTSAFRR